MTKKHAPQYFICNLNFKSRNFQTESPFKRAVSTYRGSTTLSFFSPCYALHFGQVEFKTLPTLCSAFSKRMKFFCTRPSKQFEEEQYLLVIDTFIIYESIGGSGSTLSGVVGVVTLVCPSLETRESTHPCGNT
jgi:hypothetical protein